MILIQYEIFKLLILSLIPDRVAITLPSVNLATLHAICLSDGLLNLLASINCKSCGMKITLCPHTFCERLLFKVCNEAYSLII